MSGTRRKSAWRLALVVSLGMVMSFVAESAGAATTTIDSIKATAPKEAPGTIMPNGSSYTITIPFFAINVDHKYELSSSGKVVDSFTYKVSPTNGQNETIATDKGGTVTLKVDHTSGLNGSPSKGTGTYTPPPAAKKTKNKKKSKK